MIDSVLSLLKISNEERISDEVLEKVLLTMTILCRETNVAIEANNSNIIQILFYIIQTRVQVSIVCTGKSCLLGFNNECT